MGLFQGSQPIAKCNRKPFLIEQFDVKFYATAIHRTIHSFFATATFKLEYYFTAFEARASTMSFAFRDFNLLVQRMDDKEHG